MLALHHIAIGFLLFLTLPAIAQEDPRVLDIRSKFQAINQDTSYSVVQLENEEFLDPMTDGGGELTGYFKGDTCYKIVELVGLSYGILVSEFYFWNGELMFVYETEETFQFDSETGELRHDVTQLVFQGRYYFDGDNLFLRKEEGKRTFDEEMMMDSQTKEGALVEEARRNMGLLSMPYENSILTITSRLEDECKGKGSTATIENQEWVYCRAAEGLEMVEVEYREGEFIYREQYILQDEELIYAKESEDLNNEEGDIQHWHCEYILKDGAVVYHVSLGHGETESDEWTPESIIEQWEGRKTGLDFMRE